MTRLEKLKSLCADNGITGYVSSLRKSELSALLALVEQQHKALEGINIWVANDDQHEIAAAMHNALTAFNDWNEEDVW